MHRQQRKGIGLALVEREEETVRAMGVLEFGGPESIRRLCVEAPACGQGQVLIRVEYTSVNYADIQTRRGAYHAGGKVFPVIPGLDAMGIVEAVGNGVRRIRIGQRVVAFPHTGTYADYVAADENLVFPVPEAVSPLQAAACPLAAFTAYMLLSRIAALQAGETLLLHAAAGGVGTTAIQIARSLGAGRIIGAVGSPGKRQAVLDAGADQVLCHGEGGFAEAVNVLTNGRGVDVILDSLGGRYTEQGMNCLAPYGRMVVFGNASGRYSGLDTQTLHASCRSVRGFSIGSTRSMRPEWFSETAEKVFPLLNSGALQMRIARVLPLEEAALAHALVEGRQVCGKVILQVSGTEV